jgi:hypothetical protein
VRRRDVEAELFHEPGQAWRLTLRQVEDEPGERGRVDDRVLERAFQAAANEPSVKSVVAVFHQDRRLRKAQECAPRVPELGRTDQHRALNVMPPAGIGIDRGAAVDERVEERQRPREGEPLGPDLQHEERGVAGRLHVQRHELRVFEPGPRPDLGRVDSDLFPRHRFDRATRF